MQDFHISGGETTRIPVAFDNECGDQQVSCGAGAREIIAEPDGAQDLVH